MTIARYFSPRLRSQILAGNTPDWLRQHIRVRYISKCVVSTPPWADRMEMKLLRFWAHTMTAFTGVRHVLDHIVPIDHPHVSGLTVPWNLRVVPYMVNAAKGNRWHPDQLELLL